MTRYRSGHLSHCMQQVLLATGLLLVGLAALGQGTLQGPGKFPEFRGLSGLAGGGFGVDAYGRPSLSGPTAYSTPTAYVLGHGHCQLTIDSIAANKGFQLGGKGNQTLIAMYGHTVGHVNIAFTDMVLTGVGDQAYNFQVEYVPSPMKMPDGSLRMPHAIFSVGVQDFGGGGGSSGQGLPGDARSSRSVFGVVTYRLGNADRSPYVSMGLGSRRFAKSFASGSYQVLPPVRLWIEYDGFGVNFGALTVVHFTVAKRPMDFQFGIASVFGRYLATSAGLGF